MTVKGDRENPWRGTCPDCGGVLYDVWDLSGNEPTLHGIECLGCDYSRREY